MKLISMIRRTFQVWFEARATTFGASLSYYTLFSLAPLVVIAVTVAGLIFGEQAASGQLAEEIEHVAGSQVATALQDVLQNASRPQSGGLAIVISLGVLFLGASGVFIELQTALNAIWGIPPTQRGGLLTLIRDRFLSFSMILLTAGLLLTSVIISTVLTALTRYWSPESLPGGNSIWEVVDLLISLGVITAMFAGIYRLLPDVRLSWRQVGIGALVTAALFLLGKYLLGLYLGLSISASAFGAAGSLAVVLVWVYYSAQIILFGAAITRVLSESRGESPPITRETAKKQLASASP